MTDSVAVQRVDGIRCSDADRERTSARLRDAAGAGYLTMDELDERLSVVYAARYGHELDALVTDLPRARWAGTAGRFAVPASVWARLLPLVTGRTRRRVLLAVAAVVAIAAVAGFVLDGLEVFEGAEDDGAADGAEDDGAEDGADDD